MMNKLISLREVKINKKTYQWPVDIEVTDEIEYMIQHIGVEFSEQLIRGRKLWDLKGNRFI